MNTLDWKTELPRAMVDATNHLKDGDIFPAFRIIGKGMTEIWENAKSQGEFEQALSMVREHELFRISLQDPYSQRAFHKPRGYAGDAVMMDYIYAGIAPENTSDLGKAVFAGTTRGSMGLSVLFRRNLLTAHINDTVFRANDFKILSVASGHCREIEGSFLANPAVAKAGRLVAFDQDEASCNTVRHDYANYPVDVICASVRQLLAGSESSLGKFDLIYSAGLFDYLTDDVAEKLVAAMSSMLRPGGKLLIGNFAPTCYGRGYLELFLDWKLIYRDADELCRIFGDLRSKDTKSFLDPHGNVVYAEWINPA